MNTRRNHKILVVENDPKMMDMLKDIVGFDGYNVIPKKNMKEGLEYIRDNIVFLVFAPCCLLNPKELDLFKKIKQITPRTIRCLFGQVQCEYNYMGNCALPGTKEKIKALLKGGEIHEFFHLIDVSNILERIEHWFKVYTAKPP